MSQGKAFSEWFAAQQQADAAQRDLEEGPSPASSPVAAPPFWQFWKTAPPPPSPREDEAKSLLPSFLRRAPAPAPAPSALPSISRADRMKGFVIMMLMAGLFFSLAFFIGLPMILLAPSKFALSFTLGSLCFMTGFALLEGPAAHLKHMCSRERLPFTLIYFATMLLTLYSSLILKSYIAVVVSACAQLAALAWYGATYIPGGTAGMKFITHMVCSSLKAMLKPCFKMLR